MEKPTRRRQTRPLDTPTMGVVSPYPGASLCVTGGTE